MAGWLLMELLVASFFIALLRDRSRRVTRRRWRVMPVDALRAIAGLLLRGVQALPVLALLLATARRRTLRRAEWCTFSASCCWECTWSASSVRCSYGPCPPPDPRPRAMVQALACADDPGTTLTHAAKMTDTLRGCPTPMSGYHIRCTRFSSLPNQGSGGEPCYIGLSPFCYLIRRRPVMNAPLRPLSTGELLDRTSRSIVRISAIYRRNLIGSGSICADAVVLLVLGIGTAGAAGL